MTDSVNWFRIDVLKRTAQAIVIDPRDNVAVALHDLSACSTVRVRSGDRIISQKIRQEIPRGHKLSITPIPPGGNVIKYGENIGRATSHIDVGEHVHVHNVASQRSRGDLKGR